jgi:DNA excision repair protein ERCC-2
LQGSRGQFFKSAPWSPKAKEQPLKRKIRIAVRELVEYTLRSGDLVLEVSFASGVRAVDGIRAHQKVQEQRPEEYDAEVTVLHQIETEDFTVSIGGRIDGVYRYPDHAVVDEIKTTTRNLDSLEKEQKPIHWGQVKIYAYIYGIQNNLENIDAQLTYYHLDTTEKRELRESYTIKELESFFNQLLEQYLKWLKTLEQWYRKRDESIQELSFPFEKYRPGQRRMALEIYRTIENQGQFIAEAPTGIGKTMAAVFPAVKAIGNGLTEKFFYLTAKTTGRTVAQNALEDLREKGLRFKSLTLTAKDKICFCPESACNGEECEYARGYYDRINQAVEKAFTGNTCGLTRDVIENAAREFNVCPFEFSLDMALWVDAVICDYNYAFDPRVFLRRFFAEEISGKKYAFLVDEANNLVDRAREMFSAELFKQPFLDLRRQLKGKLPEVYKSLGAVNTRLVKSKKECREAGKPISMDTYPSDMSSPLRKFLKIAEEWLVKNIQAPFRQDLLTLYFEVNWFLKVAENYYEAYAVCFEIVDDDFRVKLFCMDPSQQMEEALERAQASVFFSATLSPIDYFRQILGCDIDSGEMILPSPFPPEHLYLPVADRVSTLYRYREQTKMTVARLITALTNRQPGNYLVFFPSYVYMKKVYEIYAVMNPKVERIIQESGMSEAQREEFLESFSEDNRENGKTLVGFAVMGGIFGEGIDLKGDRLTGAAIVGVGLPGISLERELIKNYFAQLQGTGFEYAYLYPGMNRVFQAAGRVIRTDHDRGVVLLIGHRFSNRQYSTLLPRHWNPSPVRDENHLSETLNYFWGE